MQVVVWLVETWPQLWQAWMAIGMVVVWLVAWFVTVRHTEGN